MIAIADYGIGNLGSILNMIRHVGGEAEISRDPGFLREAQGLVIPGVGSFDACMLALRRSGLLPVVEERALEARIPVLGVCVGMQMMARGSEEGTEAGLGWFAARCRRFDNRALKVPHMGWSAVSAREGSPLFAEPGEDRRFYFVHSYHVVCDHEEDVEALAHYGAPFVAAIGRDNLYGVQFHPEKSHQHGMQLFRNFLSIVSRDPVRSTA
jgi:imidazole glycerol-phosphate synthase subunit HisH